jgi:uncharacterized membrane protein
MMGYILLIAGVALFAGAHWVKRLAPEKRAAWGDKGKGVLSILMLGAVVLMVVGYRNAGFVNVWVPPAFMTHIANLLVLIGFWFFALSAIPGTLSARVRHKQLTGVKAWAVAHLLVNGDLASIILFGGMLAWAVVSVILINRADRNWTRPANASVKNDIIAFAVGAVLYGIVAAIHTWLGYYPFPM